MINHLFSIIQTAEYTPLTYAATILQFSYVKTAYVYEACYVQSYQNRSIESLGFVMTLQCPDYLPQELLFATVSVQQGHTRMIITDVRENVYFYADQLTSQLTRCSGT